MGTVGVLLAGGQSRRFGSPKAFAEHQGKRYYEIAWQALAAVCDHVVVATNDSLRDRFPPELHLLTDHKPFQGRGPLAGIYTAMLAVQAERYMVLPCDMPYITAAVLRPVLASAHGCDVCGIRVKDRKHPLVSCWSRSMLVPLHAALESGQYGVMKLLASCEVKWLDGRKLTADAHAVFRNMNRPVHMKDVM